MHIFLSSVILIVIEKLKLEIGWVVFSFAFLRRFLDSIYIQDTASGQHAVYKALAFSKLLISMLFWIWFFCGSLERQNGCVCTWLLIMFVQHFAAIKIYSFHLTVSFQMLRDVSWIPTLLSIYWMLWREIVKAWTQGVGSFCQHEFLATHRDMKVLQQYNKDYLLIIIFTLAKKR